MFPPDLLVSCFSVKYITTRVLSCHGHVSSFAFLAQRPTSVIAICTNWHVLAVLQRNTYQYAYDVLACIVAFIVVCIGGMY